MVKWLVLLTFIHGVPCLSPVGGKILFKHKQLFIITLPSSRYDRNNVGGHENAKASFHPLSKQLFIITLPSSQYDRNNVGGHKNAKASLHPLSPNWNDLRYMYHRNQSCMTKLMSPDKVALNYRYEFFHPSICL